MAYINNPSSRHRFTLTLFKIDIHAIRNQKTVVGVSVLQKRNYGVLPEISMLKQLKLCK